MQYSQELINCHSIDDVVSLINNNGTSCTTPCELAAQYALRAINCKEDNNSAGVEAHLCFLQEAGAMMDVNAALEIAKPHLPVEL